ncbi:adenylate kinase isoenzyme 6 homolog [Plakobranchus ocellatus]|uniref:Adenylate kinase isoenzyme 6 homolog n=1 Tax=Plakobranchus ocellatus TaxID=259542 RepID=A0AAV4CV39_9GAST|nr:adenylate kinase isoenzyme 6 homolog [Plakobranchus ocellatus]
MANQNSRVAPNLMIAGTPGTGKSTLGKELCQRTGLNYVSVGEVAEAADCMDGYDDELQCGILDEDRIIDELEDVMSQGGNVVDYHSCDFFPERWFDIVFVLRTDNGVLHSRLTERGYNEKKIESNISSEIFQVILDEARDSYADGIVHELPSNTADELESNLDQIIQWLETWKMQH